ncbi:hypothetical protein SAMN04487907_101817 [Zunongwangia mangrovi]|uniref:Uncharacterized protein n=1 Tax=Zunongwangia mangrovi TaxID=1334022 RepID=A0A1I1ED36_9FLAO|nr:hypothetical protein SAMN04487907_101817 [Zunongwangia mangrovi]
MSICRMLFLKSNRKLYNISKLLLGKPLGITTIGDTNKKAFQEILKGFFIL